MFDTLSDRLQDTFARLRGHGRLSEAQVDAALREVRLALLEADVNFKVVKDFIARVRERAVGEEVTRSLTPAQQVVKIVHEELVVTLGERNVPLQWSPRPDLDVHLHTIVVGTVPDSSIPTGARTLDPYARVDLVVNWTLTRHWQVFVAVDIQGILSQIFGGFPASQETIRFLIEFRLFTRPIVHRHVLARSRRVRQRCTRRRLPRCRHRIARGVTGFRSHGGDRGVCPRPDLGRLLHRDRLPGRRIARRAPAFR